MQTRPALADDSPLSLPALPDHPDEPVPSVFSNRLLVNTNYRNDRTGQLTTFHIILRRCYHRVKCTR
jgi:hypothetical protein